MCSASLIRIKSELTDSIKIWRARFLWPYLQSIICSSRFCSSQWIRRNSKLIKSQTRAASLLTLRKILLFKTQKRLNKFPFFFCPFIFPTSKTTTAEHIWIYALLIFLYIIKTVSRISNISHVNHTLTTKLASRFFKSVKWKLTAQI